MTIGITTTPVQRNRDGAMARRTLVQTIGTVTPNGRVLIGRSRQVGEIARLMSRSRLLTLTGIIGVGKSSLAFAVAEHRKSAFTAGIFAVNVAHLAEGSETGAIVRGVLGRTVHNRTASGSRLVIMDNCEHAIDDAARLAYQLLSADGTIRVLATSRQTLQIPGETVYPVQPLFEHAAALFVERVTSQRAGSAEPGRPDPATVAELCDELDGVPAAIELAAEWNNLDDPGELLRRVRSEEGEAALRGIELADSALARCSDEERAVCAELAVFHGPFDLPAAEFICADSEPRRESVATVVASLVDKSVVVRAGDRSRGLYTLPRMFQRHGMVRLRNSRDSLHRFDRLVVWYREMTATAVAEFHTDRQRDWFGRLAAEMPNIACAVNHCIADRNDVPTGLELVTSLASYWPAVGDQQALTWLLDALKQYHRSDTRRGKALVAASRTALSLGQIGLARALNNELRDLLDELADDRFRVRYAELTGLTALWDGRAAEATVLLEYARGEYEATDDEGTWRATTLLALATSQLDDGGKANDLVETAVDLAKTSGAEWSTSMSLWVAAFHHWQRRRLTQASDLAHQALQKSRNVNDWFGESICLELLAWTATLQGRQRNAARLLGAASAVSKLPAHALFPGSGRNHDWCVRRLNKAIGAQTYADAYRMGVESSVSQVDPGKARLGLPKRQVRNTSALTQRELEIARCVAAGMTNDQIASNLAVTQRTVESHLARIMMKLDLGSRAQMAVWVGRHDSVSL